MTGVRDDLLASLVEAVARLNALVKSPLTPAEAQGIIEAWLVLHLAELRGPAGNGLAPTQSQIADAVAAWLALNSESLRGPPPAMSDITEAVRLWMALNEYRMRGAPGRDPTTAEIASAAVAWLERNRESLKGANGRGIERLAISKFGDLIVYYTDGTSQNLGNKWRGVESRTTIVSRGGGGGGGANVNPLDGYRIADEDSDTTAKYYGYTAQSATTWYIMRVDDTGEPATYRYCNTGAADYEAAWIARAALTYGYLYEMTL